MSGNKLVTRRVNSVDRNAMQLRFLPPKSPDAPITFSCYAVLWSSVNTHGEQWVRGAFAESIAAQAETPIHMYYNHGHATICQSAMTVRCGKWTKLVEDDTGLYCEGELTPGLSVAAMMAAMLAHGTIDGFSICFFPIAPEDFEITDVAGIEIIRIKKAMLYEISIVDEPSDRGARIIDNAAPDTGGETVAQDATVPEQIRSVLSRLSEQGLSQAQFEQLVTVLNGRDQSVDTKPDYQGLHSLLNYPINTG